MRVRAEPVFSRATSTTLRRISVPSSFCRACAAVVRSGHARQPARLTPRPILGRYIRRRAFALELAPIEQLAGTNVVLASDQRHAHARLLRCLHQRSLFLHCPATTSLLEHSHYSIVRLLLLIFTVLLPICNDAASNVDYELGAIYEVRETSLDTSYRPRFRS
jgi:hypothetical protein